MRRIMAYRGYQFYGLIDADPTTRALTASLANTAGTRVFRQDIAPA
jgi:hypothetical protein